MSWTFHLTNLRLPTHPGGAIAGPVYVGAGSDEGYLLFKFAGAWKICDKFGFDYVYGSYRLRPVYVNVGSYMYFKDSSSSWALWYSDASTGGFGWVLSQTPGKPPLEYWNSTSSAYAGDAFYTGSLPALNGTSSFTARGSLRGSTQGSYTGTAVTVSTRFDRWESSSQFGVYSAAGSASGTKTVGLPQWTDSSGVLYTRSLSKDSNSKYSYGDISWVESVTIDGESVTVQKFILGTYGSSSGWHEASSAPVLGSSWTLAFSKPSDSEATGSDLVMTWVGYVKGENRSDIFMIEGSVWRA